MTEHGFDCGCDDESQTDRRGFMKGCGAALALALGGTSVQTAAAQHAEDEDAAFESVPELLDTMPDNWGRWGADDELGALNVLGSEEMFEGMNAATKRGKKGIKRFTLQAPMTGNAIDELVGADPDEGGTTTDTGDAMFPGRFPARRDNWADASDETLPLETPGGMAFADDAFITPLYLQGATHVDALGHGWYQGVGDDEPRIYNGVPASTTHTTRDYELGVTGFTELKQDDDGDGQSPELGEVTQTHGLGTADISNAAEAGIAGRGVLLDVGRHMGGDDGRLPLDSEDNEKAAVTLDDLQATARAQGVKVRDHDILLIRTGSLERAADPNATWDALHEPGLTYSDDLINWVHEKDIPLIGADNLAVEKIFQTVTEDDLGRGRKDLHGNYVLPLHGAFLRDLGVSLNEVMDLSDLAAQCAEDGIYEFLFTAAPLHAEMGTGAPVNPTVLKASD